MSGQKDLLAVFLAARECVARPGNDFAWSGWDDMASALTELDEVVAALGSGALPHPSSLRVLFAPTGPLQEVSINSGWADEYLKLAEDFDLAFARAREPKS